MGEGIQWMIAVASWVAALPGAVGRVSAFGVGPLLLGTAGLLVLCLLRSPLRWCGGMLAAFGVFVAARTEPPDIFVAPGAEAAAVRTASGKLSIVKIGTDSFAIRQWLAADADARSPGDTDLREGFACDEVGCTARLRNGALVSVVLGAEGLAEDCARTAVVISRRTAPPGCMALVIDRTVWPANGALALTARGTRFSITAARPPGMDRPWASNAADRRSAPVGGTQPTSAPDATPRPEDLRPED